MSSCKVYQVSGCLEDGGNLLVVSSCKVYEVSGCLENGDDLGMFWTGLWPHLGHHPEVWTCLEDGTDLAVVCYFPEAGCDLLVVCS